MPGKTGTGEFSEDMHFRVIAYLTSQVVPDGFAAVHPGVLHDGQPGDGTGLGSG